MNISEEQNQNDWGMQFTPKFHKHKIDFLDLVITEKEEEIVTFTRF